MHLLLRLTFLILSLKVLDSTSVRKSTVCNKSASVAYLNDNIESLLFSRTHNLSLKVSTNNIKNNELELHQYDLERTKTITTTATIVNASVDDRSQGSAKNNFKEDDNNHEETTMEGSNDTILEHSKLLQ